MARSPMLEAMGKFLGHYPWAHFLTLTFRPPRSRTDSGEPKPWGRYTPRENPSQPVSLPYALRQWTSFLHRLELDSRARLFWFYGVEYGERLGRLHLHALTGNTERIPPMVMQQHWQAGWCRPLVYDPRQGAAGYVAKYVTKDLADWDISDSAQEAKRFHQFRDSDRGAVEQLTRAAQARLRAAQRAQRCAAPMPAVEQYPLLETCQ